MTTASPSPAIVARDLRKSYPGGRGKPRVQALDGVSFEAEAGTIFGLLGPNGAGKSTTAKILSTLSRADAGTASVGGLDVARQPEAVRRAIGFVAQKSVSDPMASGRENLILAGRLQGMNRADARARAGELLDRFSLATAADRLAKTYSGGMARKLDVAIGLMHRPQVLFLDEPTTGLDPEARAEMWLELESMAKTDQLTVLLTTHYLEEADRLAHRLAIVDHGRVVVEGTPDELKDGLHGDGLAIELAAGADPSAALRATSHVAALSGVAVEGRILRARAAVGASALPQALGALDTAGLAVVSATVARPSLDDVYLKFTGHSYDASAPSTGSGSGVSASGNDAKENNR